MKLFIVLISLSISASALAGWKAKTRATLKEYAYACENVAVHVDTIVKDEWIEGHVSGLPTEALDKFKVVFYVKTNRWYVHPYTYYPGQEEGYSYSNLGHMGSFKVKTVKREVPSEKLAAVLVPKDYKIRPQRLWLKPLLGFIGGVLKFNCGYTVIPGNGDF